MTLPDRAPARKPSRLALYGPFALLLVAVAAWSVYWVSARGELERRMDHGATSLRAEGYEVAWSSRRVYGYPFRFDLDLAGLHLRSPSGWGLDAPLLKTEAWAYTPDHWIAVANHGVTVTRPADGAITVTGQALRASISGFDQRPPRLSVEGLNLTFTPAPRAKRFFAQTAGELHVHTLAGPDDQGAIYVSLEGVSADPSSLVGAIANGAPVSLVGDAILSHASALHGRDWPALAHGWAWAGGVAHVRQVTIQAGDTVLDARTGELTIGDDGRLEGTLPGSLRGAARPGGAAPALPVTFLFRDGKTTLAGAVVGRAPKVVP